MKNFLIIIISSFSAISANAQLQIEFGAGWRGGKLRDEAFSPLSYNNSLLNTELDFSYALSEVSRIGLQLSGALGKNSNTHFKNESYNIKLGASYIRQIWEIDNNFSIWIGGGYKYEINTSIYDLSAISFIAAHNMDLKVRSNWRNGRHSVYGEIESSILGLVTRLPYNNYPIYDDIHRTYFDYFVKELSNVKLASFGSYLNVEFNLGYYYDLSSKLALGVQYDLDYIHCSFVEPIYLKDSSLLIKVKFRL